MKNIFIFVAAFMFASALFGQDTGLIKYVPGDVDGFGLVNIRELAASPKFKDFVETSQDPKFNEFKENLKLSGIDIYNAFSSGVFFFNSKSKKGGAVLKTSISETAFNSMLANNKGNEGKKVSKTVVNGKTVYSIDNAGKKSSFVYLKPDLIACSELPEDVTALASVTEKDSAASNAKLMDYSGKINKNSMMSIVFDAKDSFSGMSQKQNQEGKKSNKGMNQLFPVDNIQGGFMSLNLTGPGKDNLNIDTHINCKDKGKAQLLAIQLQAMVMTYIPMISQGNNQLNDALMDAIKFSNEGHDIIIKADISPALQEQLKKSALNASTNGFQPQIARRKKDARPDKVDDESAIGIPPPPASK
ncbi:MAG: hypothetical protein WC637_11455 [Victivallales bacterium]